MDTRQLCLLLEVQSGVISRRQLSEVGASDNDVRRMVRRRELRRVHPRVYVNHTGPLTWVQRAWAATLYAAPGVLRDESAVRAASGPGWRTFDDGRPIQVAIDHARKVRSLPEVDICRIAGLDGQTLWNTSPPRLRPEHNAIRLASTADRMVDAVAHLADVVGARATTGARLADALAAYPRIARRGFLEEVVADVGAGTCSTLEHGFLTRVERPHGLPSAGRQVRESIKGPLFRDAVYARLGLIVELDGRMFHAKVRQHDGDLERDLDAAATDRMTVRLGWGQVFDRSCTTAFKLGRVFETHGWGGHAVPCPSCPPTLPFAAGAG